MKPRTFVLFNIFIALVIFASVFIYIFRDWTGQKLAAYIESLSICGNILEEDRCLELEKCEGIYGPNCPTCENLVFKSCQEIPRQVLLQEKKERDLCQQTGGVWQKTKYGRFCLCQTGGTKKIFVKDKGCVEQ